MKRNYGWCPDVPDQRDFVYSAPKAVKLPAKIDMTSVCPPVYDQGNLGSCTGCAISAAIHFDHMKQKLPVFTPSILFVYYNERVMENSVSFDSGAMIRDGVKTVSKEGVCPDKNWPYIISKFAKKPTAVAYKEALKHKAIRYERVTRTLSQMKGCLASGVPFICGISVYESFETNTVARTGKVPMPKKNEKLLGGHAIISVGYDDSKKVFIMRNSWGTDWGNKGYFTLPYDYLLNDNLSDDFWVIKTVS